MIQYPSEVIYQGPGVKPVDNPQVFGPPPLLESLISFWELEEESGDRVDAHGANDLTPIGTPGSTPGKVGDATRFVKASSQALSHADNSDLSLTTTDEFTFCLWVRLTESLYEAQRPLIWKGSSEYRISYLSVGSGRYYAEIFLLAPYQGAVVYANNFGEPALNTWHFIVVRYDLINLSISVNNGPPNATPYELGVFNGTGTFWLGRNNTPIYNDVDLDQVGFWKRVLTDAEVTWLYNSGNGRSYAEIAAYLGG